jgi:hypothetical protein
MKLGLIISFETHRLTQVRFARGGTPTLKFSLHAETARQPRKAEKEHLMKMP